MSVAVLDHDVPTIDIAEVAQSLSEALLPRGEIGGRVVSEIADPIDFARWLCLGRERREREAETDKDREPDPPHGHLGGGWLAGSLAERVRDHPAPMLGLCAWARPGSGLGQ